MQPKRKYAAAPAKKQDYRENFVFPLGKTNFIIMAASVARVGVASRPFQAAPPPTANSIPRYSQPGAS